MPYYLDVDVNSGDVDVRVGRRRVARPLPTGASEEISFWDRNIVGNINGRGIAIFGGLVIAGLFFWRRR